MMPMISNVVTCTGLSSTWVSIAWQAPVKGTVVGLNLAYRMTVAGGSGADIATYAAVFPRSVTGPNVGEIFGNTGSAPAACYAILVDSANELAATAQHLNGSIYVPTEIRLQGGQQIFVAGYTDSSLHGVLVSCVIQFRPAAK